MKTGTSSATGWKLTCLVVLLLLMSVGVGLAAEYLTVPEEQGLPYYARLMSRVGYTDTWAIVFYRPPEWVPETFNLLAPGGVAFDFNIDEDCPYLVEGYAIRDSEAPPGTPPLKQHLEEAEGETVEIWFIDGADARAAYQNEAEPDLTILEFLEMDSLLIGYADFFVEDLHPTGGAAVSFQALQASGSLLDGTTFSLLYVSSGGELKQTNLKFK